MFDWLFRNSKSHYDRSNQLLIHDFKKQTLEDLGITYSKFRDIGNNWSEMTISDEILKRVVESYRRIRNTLRFLLSNLSDFEYAKHAVATSSLIEIDQYALALTKHVQEEILGLYDRYEFHPAVARIMTFCSEDLGGFYLDILKDRLYTTGVDSIARRSAQTSLFHITNAMLRWMAPFLSFTTEEAWQIFKHGTPSKETIFTELFADIDAPSNSETLLKKWSRIREIRGEITKAIELEREAGKIGSSLQAELEIHANPEDIQILNSIHDDLKFVTITSSATTKIQDEVGVPLSVKVRSSTHQKCGRCWHYRIDIGSTVEHPTLCGRCVVNLFGDGETRQYA